MSTIGDPRAFDSSNVGVIGRVGRVTDRSTSVSSATTPTPQRGQVGVPVTPLYKFDLDAPPAADVDYYVAATTTGTGAKTYTLAATKPPMTPAQSNGQRWVVARNVTITVDGATTWVGTLTIMDGQNRKQEVPATIVFTGAGTKAIGTDTESGVECLEVLSIVQTSSTNNVNVTFGTGNGFGLPAPLYSNFGLLNQVLYNAAGTAYPNTELASTLGVLVPVQAWRVWDAFQTNLPGTAAADDLGVSTGAFGTAPPILVGVAANNASETQRARTLVQLPLNYVPGGTVTIRVNGKVTVAATVSSTVDVEAYESGAGSDLVTTAAQALTASNGDKDFTVTPTGLVPGDWLDIRVTTVVNDTGGATNSTANINYVTVLCQTARGTVGVNSYWAVGVPVGTSAALSNGNSRYGVVRIGTTNTPGGSQVPDGTADFSVIFVPSDTLGILGTDVTAAGISAYDKFIYRP